MVSELEVKSPALFAYWATGKGAAKWTSNPHPYTKLVELLRKAGVPEREVHGLAANIFKAVFGIFPSQRPNGGRT